MEREIEATTELRAPLARVLEVLRDDPGTVIAEEVSADERSRRAFHTTVEVQAESGAALRHEVAVDVGPVSRADDGVLHVPLSWHPTGHERLLPTFDGELVAEGDGGTRTGLALRGVYRVPLGLVGRFGDSLVGRRIARRSVSDLLGTFAGRLDAEVDRRTEARPVAYRPAPYPVDLREAPHSENYIG